MFRFPFLFVPAPRPGSETWFDAIPWIGPAVTFGIVSLAGTVAGYPVIAADGSVRSIAAGFRLGEVADTASNSRSRTESSSGSRTGSSRSRTVSPCLDFRNGGIMVGTVFVGMVALGAVGGDLVPPRLRGIPG